jgi:hypothetical protein
MREMQNAYNNLAGKAEGKRQLGRPTRKWKHDVGRIMKNFVHCNIIRKMKWERMVYGGHVGG